MIIGFDLDHTVFDYSQSLTVALSEVFGVTLPFGSKKDFVKRFVKSEFGETEWTRFQGLLYTRYVKYVDIDKQAVNVLGELVNSGHHVEIVSHKTKYPIFGNKDDMRLIATYHFQHLIKQYCGHRLNIPIIFAETLQEKVQYINSYPFDIFVDDLWDVIEQLNVTYKIWFHPLASKELNVNLANSWDEVDSQIRALIPC